MYAVLVVIYGRKRVTGTRLLLNKNIWKEGVLKEMSWFCHLLWRSSGYMIAPSVCPFCLISTDRKNKKVTGLKSNLYIRAPCRMETYWFWWPCDLFSNANRRPNVQFSKRTCIISLSLSHTEATLAGFIQIPKGERKKNKTKKNLLIFKTLWPFL